MTMMTSIAAQTGLRLRRIGSIGSGSNGTALVPSPAPPRGARRPSQPLFPPAAERDLELAARIQRHLLPTCAPAVEPFDVAAHCEPCSALGGDFYDFLPSLPGAPGALGLVIGDVSGKGVAASLLMASVLATLRAHAEDLSDVGQAMARANRDLAPHAPPAAFATAFLGRLDPRPGRGARLLYASAGHEPALLLRHPAEPAGTGAVTALDTGGLPLGVEESEEYETAAVDLGPGDVLLLYTDGLTEAWDGRGRMFGRDALRAALAAAPAGRADEDGGARDVRRRLAGHAARLHRRGARRLTTPRSSWSASAAAAAAGPPRRSRRLAAVRAGERNASRAGRTSCAGATSDSRGRSKRNLIGRAQDRRRGCE